MNEMSRKRKLCFGLSSCCGKTRSESAQMIAGKSSAQPLTTGQKCGNCCCLPFRKVGSLFKRRKVEGMETMAMDSMKPSLWERMCCCCGCCRRCRKKGEMENMENMAKVSFNWRLSGALKSIFLRDEGLVTAQYHARGGDLHFSTIKPLSTPRALRASAILEF
jgi:hypothetical protein